MKMPIEWPKCGHFSAAWSFSAPVSRPGVVGGGAARVADAGDRRGRGRRLALPGDEPFDQPRESPAHDLARLAHALELALALPAPHGEDEIVVERPLDAGCRLPE